MEFSAIRLSPLPSQPPPLSRRLLQLRALSISSFRPQPRRKNHLRPKIPTVPLPPSLAPPPNPAPLLEHIESSRAPYSGLLIVEEVVEVKDTISSLDVSNAFVSGAEHKWFPRPVFDLFLRFTVLIAVQTAVAVWFLSREDVGDLGRGNDGDVFKGKEKVVGAEKVMVVEDFERRVAEIREMASVAREREAEGNASGGVEEDGEQSEGAGQSKKSIARIFMDGRADQLVSTKKPTKLKLRNLGVGYFPKGKGFGGSKTVQSGSSINKANESKMIPIPTSSDTRSSNLYPKSLENEEIECVPENLNYVNNRLISSEIKMEASRCVSENSISNGSTDNGAEDSPKIEESSMIFAKNDRDEESMPSFHENQWWLKLPYVFGILLHRGSENRDIGLYSLPINSAAHDGKQHSYTITFQDRGDAMNFCFLLESFFEDLGNVWADIVPLTIHELDDAIRSGKMKLIVARKGQLLLYAGQPLIEVENSLRSLL